MDRDRIWKIANELKRDPGENCCVVCGKFGAELAHIVGREHDRKQPLRRPPGITDLTWATWDSKPWIVHPDRVALLCGPATTTGTCHQLYDSHQLDLLPFLSVVEQAQAVADAGSIEGALVRVCPNWKAMIAEGGGSLKVEPRVRELP